MTSIGERLREERLRRGLGIEQIAEQLKINPSMLTAIETGDLDRLPAGFFRRSFVRQYARALGLAGQDIEAEIQQIDTGEPTAQAHASTTAFRPEIERGPVAPARPSAIRSSRSGPQPLGSLIAFLAIVAICTGLYALWERTRQPQTEPASVGRTAPEAHVPATPEPAPATATPAPDATPAQPGASGTESAQPPAEPSQQGAPEQGSAQSVPPQTPAPQQNPAPQSASGAPVRVEFHAKAEVWMRIRAGGKLLFEGTLKPEEVRTFEGPEVIARIGRPGSLAVVWNGKPAPLARSDNAVTLEFTPETYRIVPPQPAAAPPADAP